MWHQPPDPDEYKTLKLTIEEIKAIVRQTEQDEQTREFDMCLRVARRVARKLYAGRFQHYPGGRIAVWVWVWHGDEVYGAANTFSRALGELFKDSGLRVAGYNPGLFSITVIFDGLTP